MTTAATFPPGAPCWIDLLTSEPDASRRFYGQLLGWTDAESSAEFGGYFMFFRDGVPVAGGMPNRPDFGIADQGGVYLSCDDAQATADRALARGARLGSPVSEIADLGISAVIADPGQARIGLWQPETFAGTGALGVPGAPAWFELHTRDYARSVEFYREVFGWDTQTMAGGPGFAYTTLGAGDTARAGILDAGQLLPEGAGAQWWVYLSVPDADASLRQVIALGGQVRDGAEDTPFGRLATVVDTTGAPFKLIQPARS